MEELERIKVSNKVASSVPLDNNGDDSIAWSRKQKHKPRSCSILLITLERFHALTIADAFDGQTK